MASTLSLWLAIAAAAAVLPPALGRNGGSFFSQPLHISANEVLMKRMTEMGAIRQGCTPVTGSYKSRIDHFTALDKRTYKMRYFINDEFINITNSTWGANTPIFLYMGGESALGSSCVCGGFFYEMAEKHGALLVGLEHRFYGETLPFDRLETENLQYLTVEQALEDAGSFLASILEAYPPGEEGARRQPPLILSYPSAEARASAAGQSRPVITVGGSYPGVLSALMRHRFPELVSGALASSAPIEATTHFFQYEDIGYGAAAKFQPECVASYKKAMDNLHKQAKTLKGRHLINQYLPLCKNLTDNYLDVDTLFYGWSMDIGGTMQYFEAYGSGPEQLLDQCNSFWAPFTANYTIDTTDPITSLKILGRAFNTGECINTSFEDMVNSSEYQDKDASSSSLNYRTWFWQKCSQVGYFRSGGNSKPFKSWSKGISSDEYYSQVCEMVYQIPVFPDTSVFKTNYGGWNTTVTNVFFANGDLDGWHGLSVLYPQNDKQVTMLNRNYSHCEDMYGSAYEPTGDMKMTHEMQEASMIQWINEYLGNESAADDSQREVTMSE